MKRFPLPAILFLLLSVKLSTVLAEVRLPAIIDSHMVLQQNSKVNIWGWCEPGEKITISTTWDTATYQAIGSAGAKWSVQVKTPAAGGPHKITIKGSNTIVLEDVMAGEVWLCSGQSNMEMSYTWGLTRYTKDVENSANKNIRFFQVAKLTADYPQDDIKGSWVVCNPEDLKRFSMAGYFFGQKLQQTLNVPVGLINASWGGTPAEVWTPKDTVELQLILKEAAGKLSPAPNRWPVNAGATYNAMINPLTNYAVAGAIWYQGESNVGTASTYTQLFQTMIGSWRTAWHKDFPFYFVQIAPYSGYGSGISSALLREAQVKTLSFPNTGMVVIHDLVDNVKDIHPQNKKDVGERLANLALAKTYAKKEIAYDYPLYKNMAVEKDKIRISFDNADKGLISKGGAITGFYIAGDDRNFVPATAKIEGSVVVVSNRSVVKPVAVRFGFTNADMPNLFNREGLPVSIFRTDEWDVNTVNK